MILSSGSLCCFSQPSNTLETLQLCRVVLKKKEKEKPRRQVYVKLSLGPLSQRANNWSALFNQTFIKTLNGIFHNIEKKKKPWCEASKSTSETESGLSRRSESDPIIVIIQSHTLPQLNLCKTVAGTYRCKLEFDGGCCCCCVGLFSGPLNNPH